MKTHMQRNAGFSLTELLVTLAIVSIFSAALYGVYVGQFKAHANQNATVDIQQDLRNSLYVLQRSIRMAGFDPSLGVRNNSPASLGIVGQFPSPHHYNGGMRARYPHRGQRQLPEHCVHPGRQRGPNRLRHGYASGRGGHGRGQ